MRRNGQVRTKVAAVAAVSAVVFASAAVANEFAPAEGSSSKITNFSAWESRSPDWAEAVHASYMETAFNAVPKGACEMRGPDGAYVNEMLVRFDEDGSKSYETRVALVIGNEDYERFDALDNPVNDATSVSRVLGALGFTVVRGADLSTAATQECLNDFYKMADGADVALLYYAGHGIAVDGVNTLLPVNASFTDETKSAVTGDIPVDGILTEMRKRAASSLLFLDACRESLNRGFEAIRPNGGRGVTSGDSQTRTALNRPGDAGASTTKPLGDYYYVYAAAPEQLASDGAAGSTHSPFTQAFLNHVTTPGRAIQLLIGDITDVVFRDTNFQQRPYADGSLKAPLWFNGEMTSRELELRSNTAGDRAAQLRSKGQFFESLAAALQGLPLNLPKNKVGDPFHEALSELALTFYDGELHYGGHKDTIRGALFFPDGSRLLTYSDDETARIWDVSSGTLLHDLSGHFFRPIYAASLNSDGSRLLLFQGYNGGVDVALFDTNSGEKIAPIGASDEGQTTLFNSSGELFAHEGSFTQWIDRENGTGRRKVRETSNAEIRSSKTGELIVALTPQDGDWDAIDTISFSEDSQLVAIAPYGEPVEIWSVSENKRLSILDTRNRLQKALPYRNRVVAVTFDRSGRYVTTGHGNEIRFWEVLTGELIARSDGHNGWIKSIALSKDGKLIASADNAGEVRIWDFETRELRHSLQFNDKGDEPVLRFTNDGRFLVGKRDRVDPGNTLIVWETSNFSVVARGTAFDPIQMRIASVHGSGLESFAKIKALRNFEPSFQDPPSQIKGKILAQVGDIAAVQSDGSLFLVELSTGRQRYEFKKPYSEYEFRYTNSSVFDNSGTLFAVSDEQRVTIYDVETGAIIGSIQDKSMDFERIVFNPVADHIAVATSRGAVRLYQIKELKEIFSFEDEFGYGPGSDGILEFSVDGSLFLIANVDQSVVFSLPEKRVVLNKYNPLPKDRNGSISIEAVLIVSASITSNGPSLAIAYSDGDIEFIQQDQTKTLSNRINIPDLADIAYSPSGDLLAVRAKSSHDKGSEIDKYYFIDADRLTTVAETDFYYSSALAGACFGFLADGMRISVPAGIFDMRNGKRLHEEDVCSADELFFSRFRRTEIINHEFPNSLPLYGDSLMEAARSRLSPQISEQVNRERSRYWEIDEALLH